MIGTPLSFHFLLLPRLKKSKKTLTSVLEKSILTDIGRMPWLGEKW
jgi:hypothetical protein